MAKKYDLAVKIGSYTDRNGDQKNRYKNIGAVMTGSDGGEFMLLDRTFNPAGVSVEPGRDSIMVSMFTPRDNTQQGEHGEAKQDGYVRDKAALQQEPAFDDEVPFN
jgi:hypothetical protein